MTVTTGTTYCDGTTFLTFYDEQFVSDLLSSDGNRVTGVASNTKLLNMLAAASGDVEAACLPGRRYTPADLAALTGNAQKKLQKLVAVLAMQSVREFHAQSAVEPLPEWKRADELLESLRKGEKIFGFVEVQDAFLMSAISETYAQRQEANGVVFQALTVFGSRTWTRR